MKLLLVLSAGSALLLAGCSQYAVVKKVHPALSPATENGRNLVTIAKQSERHPDATLPDLLQAASVAADNVKSRGGAESLKEYNFAVARIVSAVHTGGLDPWTKPLALTGGWTLSARLEAYSHLSPSILNFEPADEFKVEGSYVDTRTIREGVGAPVVVSTKVADATAIDKFAQGKNAYYGATAVARFRGRHCTLTYHDPLRDETVSYEGRQSPMAADFTAPLALSLAKGKPKKLEIRRLLNPEKYENTARLGRLQPYDPNKIPIICIHGLMDSQATWVPLINTLRGDPEIRKHYQFWFFSYPSGYPYPYSAAILRKDLDEIAAAYPGHKPAVVIGHSMGGCISRLLITDTGDKLWRDILGKSPDETRLSPAGRKLAREALIFEHRKDVARVIFMAAPLRGADMAKNWAGRLGSKLVKAPSTLLSLSTDAMKLVTFQADELQLKTIPNSVDTLAPNNRFVKAINKLPLTPGIPYHSIIGDRGKGDTPNSSDGLVPYWSSHLDGAVSEKIVPSGHSVQQNREAIAEAARILKLHARR